MDFFDKMKDSLTKFSKDSAGVARESVEKISDKATELSTLSKIKMEIKSLEHKIEESLTEFGKTFYNLYEEKKLKSKNEDLTASKKEVQDLKDKLVSKNEELKETYKHYTNVTIDKEKIKTLKSELEEGGATIDHFQIDENSPVIGKKLKSVRLPKEVLVGTILRGNKVIIPDGIYIFKKDDKVTLLGKIEDVEKTKHIINPETSQG